jgi:protein TonB
LAINALIFGVIPYLSHVEEQDLKTRARRNEQDLISQVKLADQGPKPADDLKKPNTKRPKRAMLTPKAAEALEVANYKDLDQLAPERPAPKLPGPKSTWDQTPLIPAKDLGQGPPASNDLRIETTKKRPRVLKRVQPDYPLQARVKGLEGKVVISFIVTAQGKVANASVIKADPGGIFEHSALKALQAWHFAPAERQGQAVAARVRLPIRFSLSDLE